MTLIPIAIAPAEIPQKYYRNITELKAEHFQAVDAFTAGCAHTFYKLNKKNDPKRVLPNAKVSYSNPFDSNHPSSERNW